MRLISQAKQGELAAGVAFALLAVLWMGNGAFAQDAGSGGAGTEYAPYESTPYDSPAEAGGFDAGYGATTGYDAGGGTIDPESGFYVYPEVDAGGGSLEPIDAGAAFGDGGV